jgi:hypothetical protein
MARIYRIERDADGMPVRMVWLGDVPEPEKPPRSGPLTQREIIERHNDDLRRRGLLREPLAAGRAGAAPTN